MSSKMSTKKILFQFRDTIKEITIGDTAIIHNSENKHSTPTEFRVIKIGRKYVTFSLDDGNSRYGTREFTFDGRINAEYCSRFSIYSSLIGYDNFIQTAKANIIFQRLTQKYKSFTEDQIKQATLALNLFGEYSEEFKKIAGQPL